MDNDTTLSKEKALSSFARYEIFYTLGRALWRFRRRTAAAACLLVLAKLLMVVVPLLLKRIVDTLATPGGALTLPAFLLLAYAIIRFSGGLVTELRDVVFSRVTLATVADFTVRVFDHLHSLGARFHVNRQTGALARDVERGTAGVGFLLGTALFTVLPTFVEIISVVIIMIAEYRLGFAGIVAITFVAYAIFTVLFTERRTLYQRRLNELDSAASGQLVDSLLNYETVKFYASAEFESRRLRDLMHTWTDVGIENQKALSVLHVGQSAIIAFGVGAVMLLAGQEVVSGRMTVGDLVLVNAYIIQVCLPLNTLGLIFRQAREAFINAERMSALLRFPPEADPGKTPAPLHVTAGEVRFSDVDFSYDPGRQILHQVSFHIGPGQTVAVVGGSGSGKSTLGRLLLRLYDVADGSVTIDDQDVRSVSQKSLRSAIGIVPQDTLLFNNTIAYNIAYGSTTASLADVIEAAKGASVHEFIQSLPAQYDTMVGERGVKLSGGERQRIAIARALLKNPPLLIFDEATSALDTRTERAIQAQLDAIAQGRSTLVIAHRLSTIVDANVILVMDHGRIVERGTHSELLHADGLYAQMWKLQRQQSEIEEAGSRLSAQPVNLVTLVAGVLDAIRPIVEEKAITLFTLIGSETTRITGDPSALQQLVWELCTNAVAVTPAGGRIELRLERDGPVARLSLTDGRPVPAQAAILPADQAAQEVQPARLLDPQRIAAVVEEMGGTFGWRAAGPDTGMTFKVELPLRAIATLAPATPLETVGENALDGLMIFVADDQLEARELIGAVLEDQGAGTRLFDSGNALLSVLRETAAADWPDVLLCDISLGDPDGYAVIETVRGIEANRNISLAQRMPAIALSGYTGREDRLRALLAGFQVHMSKPVDPRELQATILAVTHIPK